MSYQKPVFLYIYEEINTNMLCVYFLGYLLWMIFVLNQTISECTNYVKISKIIVVKCSF